MKIMLIVIADLFIAFAAVFGAYEAFGYKRHATFTAPFTRKMVQKKILPKDKADSVIAEDKISHIIGMVLSALVGVLMSRFIAGISGYIVFIAVAGSALLLLKPDMTETAATRSGYFNAHKDIMDALRWNEYVKEAEQ